MSQFDKKQFSDRLPLLLFLQNEQVCWNDMELAVRENAKQAREGEGTLNTPFYSWWNSAYELFSARQMNIELVNFRESEAGDEEFAVLKNSGPAILDISNWTLNAGDNGQDFTFPSGTILSPGDTARIYTQHEKALNFGSKSSIWNNKGDSAYLSDASGALITALSYGEEAHTHLSITRIEFDGIETRTEGDEFVEITNTGSHWLDISNWRMESDGGQEFAFPRGSQLAPYQAIRVYTNQVHRETGGYSFNSKTAVWNNKGDRAKLFDYEGRLVSEFSYGHQH